MKTIALERIGGIGDVEWGYLGGLWRRDELNWNGNRREADQVGG